MKDINGNTFYARYRNDNGIFIGQKLNDHLINTSYHTQELASKLSLPKTGKILGLYHDIGKAFNEFENYLKSGVGILTKDDKGYLDPEKNRGKIDHSTAGAKLIHTQVKNNLAQQILSLTLMSHHGGLIDCIDKEGDNKFINRINKQLPDDSYLQSFINSKLSDLISFEAIEKEWETITTKKLSCFDRGMLAKILLSCLVDADRKDSADFENPFRLEVKEKQLTKTWEDYQKNIDSHMGSFGKREDVINLTRQTISTDCFKAGSLPKGIFRLTVPTGGGKTLASLRFAIEHAKKHNMDRIITVIPFTSIIDQNADVARRVFGKEFVLEHHSNLTPDEVDFCNSLDMENWDAKLIYTTMVQFLESLFGAGTRGVRRLHNLINSVIIFDEIQTIPINCIALFNQAVNFLNNICGATVVLSSATQPLLDKLPNILLNGKEKNYSIKVDHDIISDTENLFNVLRRVNFVSKIDWKNQWTVEKTVDFAKDELKKVNSLLVIVNTKKAARNIFKGVQGELGIIVKHLSTSMCPEHRMLVLKEIRECLQNKQKIICVSTQLIEAGVDVDFNCVIRSLAGLDSIIQAGGRCNRNGEMLEPGNVYIINLCKDDENVTYLKDIKEGQTKASQVIRNTCDALDHPNSIDMYFNNYFYGRAQEMIYPFKEEGQDYNIVELLSGNQKLVHEHINKVKTGQVPLPLCQSFKFASEVFQVIKDFTFGVVVNLDGSIVNVVAEAIKSKDSKKITKTLRKAQRYSINIPESKLEDFLSKGFIGEIVKDSGVYYLCDQFYNSDFGLDEENVNIMII